MITCNRCGEGFTHRDGVLRVSGYGSIVIIEGLGSNTIDNCNMFLTNHLHWY